MHLIHLAAIAVCLPVLATAQATNLAPKGTATQSSTNGVRVASRANDGDTNGDNAGGSRSVTNSGPNEWWEVKLPSPELMHEIVVWNTTSGGWQDLNNFEVTLFLGAAVMSKTTVPGLIGGGIGTGILARQMSTSMTIDLGAGLVGDRVRVDMLGTASRALGLGEVELLRYDKPILNLALLGKATQSTTQTNGAVASRGNDGWVNQNFYALSISATLSTSLTPAAWWQVELPGVDRIDQIRWYNRSDCCERRMSNFRVSVFLNTLEIWGKDYYTTGTTYHPRSPALVIDLPKGTVGDRVKMMFLGPNHYPQAPNSMNVAELQVLRYGAKLTQDTTEIQAATGSTQKLAIDAGRGHAGKLYILVGSVTGTAPGFTLGGVTIPLNVDPYFLWTLDYPGAPPLTGSRGKLDTAGRAKAEFKIPAGVPSLVGVSLHHAYAVIGTTALLDAASNAALLKIK